MNVDALRKKIVAATNAYKYLDDSDCHFKRLQSQIEKLALNVLLILLRFKHIIIRQSI